MTTKYRRALARASKPLYRVRWWSPTTHQWCCSEPLRSRFAALAYSFRLLFREGIYCDPVISKEYV